MHKKSVFATLTRVAAAHFVRRFFCFRRNFRKNQQAIFGENS